MKKKILTSLFIIGFASGILGLIMGTLGVASGGIEDLKELTRPEEFSQTFSNINALDIHYDTYFSNVIIRDSKDEQVHVTANYFPEQQSKPTLSQKDKTLTVYTGSYRSGLHVNPLKFIGEQLNHNEYNHSLIIEVPKTTTLEKLSIFGGNYTSLSDLHIKELISDAVVEGNNLTIDKGTIVGGSFSNSQLKQLTSQYAHGEFRLENSSLDSAEIHYNNWLSITNSSIKNSTFTSPYASFVGNQLTLENTSIVVENASIDLKQLTVRGQVSLETAKALSPSPYANTENSWYQSAPIDVHLAHASKEVSLEAAVTGDGQVLVSDKLTSINKTDQSANRDKSESKDKLIIKTTDNTISLN